MHSTLTNLQEWSTLAEANMFHSLPSPTISNTFNPLVKDLFIFPSWHLFAIGAKHIFSCRWNLPPVLRSSPKERDSRNKAPCTTTCTWHTGLEPSWMFFFQKAFTCTVVGHSCPENNSRQKAPIPMLCLSMFIRHYSWNPMWFWILHLLICLNSVGEPTWCCQGKFVSFASFPTSLAPRIG